MNCKELTLENKVVLPAFEGPKNKIVFIPFELLFFIELVVVEVD